MLHEAIEIYFLDTIFLNNRITHFSLPYLNSIPGGWQQDGKQGLT